MVVIIKSPSEYCVHKTYHSFETVSVAPHGPPGDSRALMRRGDGGGVDSDRVDEWSSTPIPACRHPRHSGLLRRHAS